MKINLDFRSKGDGGIDLLFAHILELGIVEA